MPDYAGGEVTGFLSPRRVYSREQVLARPSPVPAAGGVYGWRFGRLPPLVDAGGCRQHDGLTLLYTGISPREPPGNGRPPSRQNLQSRLRAHYAGNAEGSTLRKTLGCLLAGNSASSCAASGRETARPLRTASRPCPRGWHKTPSSAG